MKKLNLKLDGKKMLTKEQMKKVNGGYDCEHTGNVICYYSNGTTYTMSDWFSEGCSSRIEIEYVCRMYDNINYEGWCCSCGVFSC